MARTKLLLLSAFAINALAIILIFQYKKCPTLKAPIPHTQSQERAHPKKAPTLSKSALTNLKNGSIFILDWNNWYKRHNYKTSTKNLTGCKYQNCIFTQNKTYLPVEHFDAIVFDGAQYQAELHGTPETRSPEQIYIFFNLESPQNTPNHYLKSDGFYNWTMTYRTGSDVQFPLGRLLRVRETFYQPLNISDIVKRKKKVAWFTPKCQKSKDPMVLIAKELSKYFSVDFYGPCGNKACANITLTECYKLLSQNYKFILHFENAICMDYLTANSFTVLQSSIVPIVLGGANYDKVFPPKSTVEVLKFVNMEELVQQLKYLDENPQKYLNYFNWKSKYLVRDAERLSLCRLCTKLNQKSPNKVYKSVAEWWKGNDRQCIKNFVDEFTYYFV